MSGSESTPIPGCFRFKINPRFQDTRGFFVKPLHKDFLKTQGIEFECRESFISFSKHTVLRGMHFQIPPFDHDKIVSCIDGEIFDVVVDLRPGSPTDGLALSFKLSGESGEALFIPRGCAHGFQVLTEKGAWVAYYTSREYHPASDQGIHWKSVPIEWPLTHPIVSDRDEAFAKFGEVKYFS
jgi:dTDP-4-dehydrorhamnose 3,5-epimerase